MFLSVSSWWNMNTDFQRVLFIIAAAATLIMIVQIVLIVIGLGGDDASFDYDGNIDDVDLANDEGLSDAAGLRILSIRSALAFLAVGGWMTYTMAFILPWWASLLIGMAVGAAAAVGVAFLLKSIMKLQSNGNINLVNAVGKVGEVYLTIPASRKGSGKVNLTIQDSFIEREAVTDSETPIKTGEKVSVVKIIGDAILLVEPLTKEA